MDTADRAWMQGTFTPTQRDIDLHERYALYYGSAPEVGSRREEAAHYATFKRWCTTRGYTLEELRRAKRSVLASLPHNRSPRQGEAET